jgi:hypothetical protein
MYKLALNLSRRDAEAVMKLKPLIIFWERAV